MKKNIPILLSIPLAILFCCSPNKKTQETVDSKQGKKEDIYSSIHKIAEELPLTSQQAADFFINLDSVQSRSFRSAQSQQFQYKAYTVFYAQPTRGKKLRGVGIDLDSTSQLNMDQLAKQLNTRWHSASLIEVKAGRIHYSTEYIDNKKFRKKINITVEMKGRGAEEKNSISFISIDMEPEKKTI